MANLRTAPLIGPVTASAFVACVDEPRRFKGPHQVEAYVGLVPSEMSSGEKQRKGRITKTGNARARWLLVQAALSILRRSQAQTEHLRTWAERIASRRGWMGPAFCVVHSPQGPGLLPAAVPHSSYRQHKKG